MKVSPCIALTCLPVTMIGTGRPFWSLAIEFWLYIFYGYAVLTDNNGLSLKGIYLLLFIVSLPVVILNCFGGKGNGLAMFWFFGVFSMYFLRNYQDTMVRKWPIYLALLFSFFGSYWVAGQNFAEYNFHANAIICTVLFLLIVSFHNLKYSIFSERTKEVIRFLASYSFTLYASHYTVLYWLDKTLAKSNDGMLLFVVGFMLSNLIAIGLAYCFEMNYKELRLKVQNLWIDFQFR